LTLHPLTSHAVVHSGLARVTLAGELDLDTASYVHEAVTACLREQPTSLCLDLTGVSFCDCAGLSTLLRARTSALRAGVDLVLEGVGSQLARLLSLTGSDDLFAVSDARTSTEPARCAWETAAPPSDTATAAAGLSPLRDLPA
jgi:anti-anti-sigma factor